jgi:hypothetical protein
MERQQIYTPATLSQLSSSVTLSSKYENRPRARHYQISSVAIVCVSFDPDSPWAWGIDLCIVMTLVTWSLPEKSNQCLSCWKLSRFGHGSNIASRFDNSFHDSDMPCFSNLLRAEFCWGILTSWFMCQLHIVSIDVRSSGDSFKSPQYHQLRWNRLDMKNLRKMSS